MRLNKFIASSGIVSRREADRLIFMGLVSVNGEIVTEPGRDVNELKDVVKLKGKKVVVRRKKKYIKLYKPSGVLSSINKDDDRDNLLSLFPIPKGLNPVGRLDFNTEGLLILTDDGDFIYKMTHPKFEIPRRYYVKIRGVLSNEELELVTTKGVEIEKGVTVKFDGIKQGRILKNSSWWYVVVHEGKYHEVRRIFEAIGHKVSRLIRLSFGDIELGELSTGEYRNFSREELRYVKKILRK